MTDPALESILGLLLAMICLAAVVLVLVGPPLRMARRSRWPAAGVLLWLAGLALMVTWVQSLNAAGERSDQEANLLLLFSTTYWLTAAACAAVAAIAVTARPMR